MNSDETRFKLSQLHFSLFILCFLAMTCSRLEKSPSELTYLAKSGDFIITVEAQGTLKAKKSLVVSAPMLRRVRPKVDWLPPEGTRVKKDDIVVVLEAVEVERDYISAIDEVQIANADADKAEAELTLERIALESDSKNTQTSLASSQLQLEQLQFESPTTQEIRRLEIAKDELELKKIQQKLVANKKIQKEERAKLQLQIKQSESKLKQSKHYLEQLQLKAPTDGFVVYAKDWWGNKIQVGSDVWPRQPLVEIPDISIMEVELKLNQTDAQKIKKDQPVRINIPSLDNLQLSGKVTRVDKVAKPYKRDSKVKKIDVVVEIDSSQATLVPGLSADCTIMIDNLNDVLSLPKECVFDKDSVKVVYVLQEATYVPHAVRVLKYGDDFVAINGDLTGGEMCALREPREDLVDWPKSLKPPKVQVESDSLQNVIPDSLNKETGEASLSLKTSLKP